MTTTARFVGPLTSLWSGLGDDEIAALLRPPLDALPVPSATDRGTWAADRDVIDRPTLDDLRGQAERARAGAWPQALAHHYIRYFLDGDRTGYERAVFDRQERLTRAVVLAAVTLDPDWLDEVADGVMLLCEQSTWCWPAHDDTRTRHGAVVPTVTDPYLDLGAGEVAGQLAWIDHLLADQLDDHCPGMRSRIRHEVDIRVVQPFLRRRDWHWLGLDGDVHNWNPWIHGNVLVAAMRLVDDPARRASIVGRVIQGLDRYVASLPSDGAIDEGFHYWWNGACRALEALDVLRHASRGALDATGVPALRATVAFPHRMHLGGNWFVNHADGPARQGAEVPWRELHRAAVLVGDDDARALAASHRAPGTPVTHPRHGLGRALRALADLDWRDAQPRTAPLPRDVWLPSTQVLLTRPRTGSPAGLTLAAKGGHNGEHHNHDDVGSVIVAVGGVPVLVDAGRPTYTAQTFGPERHRIRTTQSSWHNVPEVRGTPQGNGAGFRARGVHASIGEAVTALTLDLAGAYPRNDLRSWRRSVRLDRNTGTVILTDEWDLDPDPDAPPSVLRLLCAGEVTTGPGGATIEALEEAGTVGLRWSDEVGCTADMWELDDPILQEQWGHHLTRLTLDLGAVPHGVLIVTIKEA